MATVSVRDGTLRLKMKGVDRVLALRSRIDVPLDHVTGAAIYRDVGAKHPWLGVGTSPGGDYSAARVIGGMWQQADWVFWDVHDPDEAVAIELADEHYGRLVVQVDNPQRVVDEIEAALTGTTRASSGWRDPDSNPRRAGTASEGPGLNAGDPGWRDPDSNRGHRDFQSRALPG
jgi:hypothetical protein